MIAVNSQLGQSLSALRDEVDQLRQFRIALAKRLEDEADQLDSAGIPPSADLISDLRSYGQKMHDAAQTLGAGQGAFGDLNVGEVSLADLELLIDSQLDHRLAEVVLEQLNDLTHVDVPDFAPLVLCQREASRLCELATGSIGVERDSELELLRTHQHPLNALIRLCDEGDVLSDLEWTECHDAVAATYGRQLATALTRGRIQRRAPLAIRPTVVSPVPPPRPIPNPAPAAPVVIAEAAPVAVRAVISTRIPAAAPVIPAPVASQAAAPVYQAQPAVRPLTVVTEPPVVAKPLVVTPPLPRTPAAIDLSESVFEPKNETIFDEPPTKPGSGARARLAAMPLESRTRSQGAVNSANAIVPMATPVTASVTASVGPIETAVAPRSHSTTDLVLRTIRDGRLSQAWHLNRCLEQRSGQTETPPSWLLRALILGRHLSYSKGEIARELDEALREYRPEVFAERSHDYQLAMSFLLRGAALPAALLAGSAPAAALLRSFKIAPGFSQLYNYCSRVALYGDRLAGSLGEMFRPTGAITGASELEELKVSALGWLQETARKHVAYSRTSPLFLHAHWTLMSGTAVRYADQTLIWCKWQETLTLAGRLLKPVIEGTDGDRNWVRQEIARLTSLIRVEPVDLSNRGPGQGTQAGRGIVLPLEEMHAVILEAVAIANRWLRLCHQTASGGGSPIPLEALELRDEILKRTEGVLAELHQHRMTATSPIVEASVACCQQTVRQIQALFESRVSLPLVEPDSRHALNAELLRIPGIELNDQWLPETEPAVIERELTASLERPELSWSQAYEYHAQNGNHEATGRLLELEVWTNAEERESLRSLRPSQISDCRATAETELRELGAEIHRIVESGTWGTADCATLQKRLERLRYELPRVLNFPLFRRQISQLHAAIVRQIHTSGLPSGPGGASGMSVVEMSEPRRRPLTEAVSPRQPAIPSCDIFSGE